MDHLYSMWFGAYGLMAQVTFLASLFSAYIHQRFGDVSRPSLRKALISFGIPVVALVLLLFYPQSGIIVLATHVSLACCAAISVYNIWTVFALVSASAD